MYLDHFFDLLSLLLSIDATSGKKVQIVPRNVVEADRLAVQIVNKTDFNDFRPLEFADRIDEKARDNESSMTISLALKILLNNRKKEDSILQAYVSQVHGWNKLTSDLRAPTKDSKLANLFAGFSNPSIRHNHKFFLNPAVFHQYFNLHPNRTATLNGQQLIIGESDILPAGIMEKPYNVKQTIGVTLFTDAWLESLTDSIKMIKKNKIGSPDLRLSQSSYTNGLRTSMMWTDVRGQTVSPQMVTQYPLSV